MAIYFYSYADSGAPQITATPNAGALITILDACLVNGYGTKPSMGWTKAFSGTNKAAYQQPISTNNFYLRVDDNYNHATYGRYALVTGYESMTNVDTGLMPFPTTAQESTGGETWWYYYSGYTAGESVPWYLISDGKLFHFIVQMQKNFRQQNYLFGDFLSYLMSDSYNTILTGCDIAGACYASRIADTISSTYFTKQRVVARNYQQSGGSTMVSFASIEWCCGSGIIGGTGNYLGNPALADGAYHGFPMWVLEYYSNNQPVMRGIVPGIYIPAHYRPFNNGDTFTDANGHSYIAIATENAVGRVFFRTTAWDEVIPM